VLKWILSVVFQDSGFLLVVYIKIRVMVSPQLATKPHTAACLLPPGGMEERIGRVKVRKLLG